MSGIAKIILKEEHEGKKARRKKEERWEENGEENEKKIELKSQNSRAYIKH